MSEVVKIVFDIDSADVKSSTDELKALKKIGIKLENPEKNWKLCGIMLN